MKGMKDLKKSFMSFMFFMVPKVVRAPCSQRDSWPRRHDNSATA